VDEEAPVVRVEGGLDALDVLGDLRVRGRVVQVS
jgi:hypothetical protein